MIDQMGIESGPKTTEVISPNNAEAAAIKVVSRRFHGLLGEKAKSVARMVTQKPALTVGTLALIVYSGCANAEKPSTPTPTEPTPISTPIATSTPEPTPIHTPTIVPTETIVKPTAEPVKTPEKQGLNFDGKHVLLIPHSTELDGRKGMEINVSFMPVTPEIPANAVEGTRFGDGYLVIGGNTGSGGSSYALSYHASLGKDREILYGIDFSAGGLNTGLYPSKETKLSGSDQLITVNANVSESGIPMLTVNNEEVLGYNLASRLSEDDRKKLRESKDSTVNRPSSSFNNNGSPVLVGARLFKDGGADGGFKGTIGSLRINDKKIDINPANLQEVQR